jgi:carboxypeptidase T
MVRFRDGDARRGSGTLPAMRLPLRAPVRLARASGSLLLAAGLALGLNAPAATPAKAAEPDFPSYDSGYHNWPEMVAEIMQAQTDYPSIVKVFSIGKSYQGRDIWAAKISDNVDTDEAEPEVLIDALHHAREHFTTEQALALLGWLTRGYGTDPTITHLVDTREIYIVFALNPDGMRYDLTGDPFRAWRKNLQRTASGVPIYTDLNRNYAYRWACCGGSSSNRSSETYHGPNAWSAPETRALRDFVNSRVVNGIQQIRTHITLHTNGELILWPYGYTKTNVPRDMTVIDHAAFVALGRAMAKTNGYTPEQSSDLYITDGDQIDWLYHQYRIFTYTFELYPPETPTVWGDHYPDDSTIPAQTLNNKAAILHLIDAAGCPYEDMGAAAISNYCGPFYDDMELNRGWTRNPDGTDTATSGRWDRVIDQPTYASGPKQLSASSGQYALATGGAAGSSAQANDLDGVTTIRSRAVALDADPAKVGELAFRYTFAHGAASSDKDWFRVQVEAQDGTRTTVAQQSGRPADRDGSWVTVSVNIDAWAGQTIRIVVQAKDGGPDNLVEAAIDDVRIRRQ